MSEIQWFWEQDGEQQGPIGESELRAKFENDELGGETLVWHEGLSDWKPASTVGLVTPNSGAAPETGPPPVPASPPAGQLVPVQPSHSHPAAAPVREARLREDFRPRIRSSFGRAWELLKTDFWPFVGVFALMTLITGVAAQLYVTIFFLIYPLMAGLSWYLLNRKRGNPVTIDALFFGFKRRFGDLALLNLILTLPLTIFITAVIGISVFGLMALVPNSAANEEVALIAMAGVCLVITFIFVIPLFLIYVIGNFASTLIIDCDISWKRALKLGWQATKPHLFKMILFGFLYSFVTQLGLIALYFGIFITGAWASIAFIYLYEDAFGDEEPS